MHTYDTISSYLGSGISPCLQCDPISPKRSFFCCSSACRMRIAAAVSKLSPVIAFGVKHHILYNLSSAIPTVVSVGKDVHGLRIALPLIHPPFSIQISAFLCHDPMMSSVLVRESHTHAIRRQIASVSNSVLADTDPCIGESI